MATGWPDEDLLPLVHSNQDHDDREDLDRVLEELRRRGRDRSLDRLRNELAAVRSARQATEDEQRGQEDTQDAIRRLQERMDNRDLLRRLSQGNLRLPLRRRDDVYTCDEIARQIQRERHGGYPCSPRNCLCDGGCDGGHRRRRSRSQRRNDYDYAYEPQGPQQVNVLGPVYLDGYEPDSPYISYDDWPPVDVYKRRWGGLLADRRLPWLTEDTFLDGNDIMRIPRRRSRRFGPYSVY